MPYSLKHHRNDRNIHRGVPNFREVASICKLRDLQCAFPNKIRISLQNETVKGELLSLLDSTGLMNVRMKNEVRRNIQR